MKNPIRIQNVLVGTIVLWLIWKAYWRGYLAPFMFSMISNPDNMTGEEYYNFIGPLGNSIFGMILFLALDTVDFVGKLFINAGKFIYYLIYDVVLGTKSLSDLLKMQDEPVPVTVQSVSVNAEVEPVHKVATPPVSEKKEYTDREIMIATYTNTKVTKAKVDSIENDLTIIKDEHEKLAAKVNAWDEA